MAEEKKLTRLFQDEKGTLVYENKKPVKNASLVGKLRTLDPRSGRDILSEINRRKAIPAEANAYLTSEPKLSENGYPGANENERFQYNIIALQFYRINKA